MNKILNDVRQSLIKEASASPNLLSDLAGLEKYIAESYSYRSFIELLQNADDVFSSRMLVKRMDHHVIVANNGRKFTTLDFETLCRSAASKKERKTDIGFRGIGFKSVIGFAKQIHLFSGSLEATFSRELTSSLIPGASSVPLIRIPHPIDSIIKAQLSSVIDQMFKSGYNTVFVFSDLIANFVESEFESLEPSSLLFLRNVEEVTLTAKSIVIYRIRHTDTDDNSSLVELSANNKKQCWAVFNYKDVSIAVQNEGEKYIKLSPKEAVVHAFLPTSEETGFSFKINGNITTDPSRTRVIQDDITRETIEKIANLYIGLLKKCFDPTSVFSTGNFIEVLLPLFSPNMIKLQKQSFKKQLMESIKRASTGQFDNFYRRPRWLNPSDSTKLVSNTKISIPPRDIGETEGLDSLLMFLGIREVTLEILSTQLKTNQLTTQGAAEVVANITKQTATKQISPTILDKNWKIWSVNNENLSLSEVARNRNKLDEDFTDIVTEKVGIPSELPRLIAAIVGVEISKDIIPPKKSKDRKVVEIEIEEPSTEIIPSKSISLVKWRSAEQQVLEILNSNAWKAKDVSRQNIGYDIEAINPSGEIICVEVKLIKYEGQHFTLTSNEEATAREKGKSYWLALVIQKKDQLHVMFIKNPLNVMQLERQCKQWVWLCSSYDFKPKIYEFNL